VPGFFNFLIELALNLGMLALAVALSALLSKYRQKVVTILGLVASMLALLIWAVLIVVSKL
jgi:hypothetical protein